MRTIFSNRAGIDVSTSSIGNSTNVPDGWKHLSRIACWSGGIWNSCLARTFMSISFNLSLIDRRGRARLIRRIRFAVLSSVLKVCLNSTHPRHSPLNHSNDSRLPQREDSKTFSLSSFVDSRAKASRSRAASRVATTRAFLPFNMSPESLPGK